MTANPLTPFGNIPVVGGQRCDLALLAALRFTYPDLSRARLKACFERKLVRFADRAIAGSYEVPAGPQLLWLDEAARELLADPVARPDPAGLSVPIIYEDSDLLVLAKPSGMPSVPHAASESGTAVNQALSHLPELAGRGRRGLEATLLHRLDTETSGLLAFARTDESFERLRAAWSTPAVEKIYRACVAPSSPDAASALRGLALPLLIQTPLAHDAKSARRMRSVTSDTRAALYRGEPLAARTEILERVSVGRGQFELTIRIETGVMHQIRAHLASQDWPILGDALYGGILAARLWLHAWRLRLPGPGGQPLGLEAPLPEDWASP